MAAKPTLHHRLDPNTNLEILPAMSRSSGNVSAARFRVFWAISDVEFGLVMRGCAVPSE
jgi:hypothetical protein